MVLNGGPLVINEFMAINDSTLADEDGDPSDWIEIHNQTAATVDLDGWYLTNDAADPTRWQFPDISISANGYMVLLASGKNRTTLGWPLHTNFELDGDGGYLGLVEPDGVTVAHDYGQTYPAQEADVSYGMFGVPPSERFFTTPTPGTPNTTGELVISEFMASNGSFLAENGLPFAEGMLFDGDGNASDWIEIHNPNAGDIILDGWHLTDDRDDLTKWSFPDELPTTAETTIGGGEYLVVFASGQDVDDYVDTDGYRHTNFNLSSDGEYLALVAPGGQSADVIFEYAPEFPEQATNVSYGLVAGSSGELRHFDVPSPGEANPATGLLGVVGDTTFSHDRGLYDATFQLDVTTDTPGATIYYTTDGSTPDASSPHVDAVDSQTPPVLRLTISTTTLVRAYAAKPDYVSTNIDTQTYIYPAVVATRPNLSSHITGDPTWGPLVDDALLALPTVSIVLSSDVFNDEDNEHEIETPVSFEMFYPDGSRGFQIDAGAEHFGNYSLRDYPKKSLRLSFKNIYGDSKLRYDVFDDDGVDVFDKLLLRAGGQDSLFYSQSGPGWDGNGPAVAVGTYVRNRWSFDRQIEMGQPAPRGRFTNVYINGQYWGQYNLMERPDGAFMAETVGGEKDDYDVIKNGQVLAGNSTAYNAMRSAASSGTYEQLQQYMDVENYADYMLTMFYGGNTWDWYNSNWMAARDRSTPGAQFAFFTWDSDMSVQRQPTSDNVGNGGPGNMWSGVSRHPEFRVMMADRAQKYFFNGGMFTPDRIKNDFRALKSEIELSMIGETARWGVDSLYTSNYDPDDWTQQFQNLEDDYFPVRTGIVIDQLVDEGIFPDPDVYPAPAISPFGGNVENGSTVAVTRPSGTGTIYYTVDGTDPRVVGGGVSPTALTANPGSITLPDGPGVIKARIKSGSTWSPIVEAEFIVGNATDPAADAIRITEIMYNPTDPTDTELAIDPTFTTSDFEFIELQNISDDAIDLTGVAFTNGVAFDFTGSSVTSLSPGQFVVVARNEAAFTARYGTQTADGQPIFVAGQYFDDKLSNSGERIQLTGSYGTPLLDFSYGDGGDWSDLADGRGPSLVLIDPTAVPASEPERTDFLEDGTNWRHSSPTGGSPGGTDEAIGVVVNEVLTHTDEPFVDAIELYNATDDPIDISGWYLSDSGNDYRKFRIPDDTTLAGGAYLYFTEEDFNPTPLTPEAHHFALSGAHGDDVWLTRVDGSGQLTHYVDHVEFGAAVRHESFGRWPEGTGDLYPMTSITLGGPNSGPRLGTVLISEIQYNPTAEVNDDDLEFVEIYNNGDSRVDLTRWKLRGGVDFNFADGTKIEAGETLVIVPFDPISNPIATSAFRSHYMIPNSGTLVGPYGGRLNNAGDTVRLRRPDEPPAEEPDFYPSLLEDEVVYDDIAPWPTGPDGTGKSLNRLAADLWGNDSASWVAAAPTPGNGEVVYPTTTWQGGDEAWSAANWHDGTANQTPPIDNDMIVNVAGSMVRVEQDFVSGGSGPAGAAAVGNGQVAELRVDATLEVNRDVLIGPLGTLSGTGTVQVGDRIEIEGTLAPGSGIATLTVQGDVLLAGDSTMAIGLSGTGPLVAGINNDLLAAADLTLTGNPALELEWLAGEVGDGLFGGIYTIATYSGNLTGTFAAPTLSADFNGADASVYIDTTYGTGGIDYGSGTNDAITVKLNNLLVGDANLDGDVDVWQFDGKGDAQVLSSNLGAAGGDGHDVGPEEAEALYNPNTGELFLDIGEDVAVVGIGSQRMYSGNVDTTSIFGRPALNDGISLAYFSSNGLPVGEDTVGLVFPTGLTPDDIIFSYTPLGGQTTYVPVAMIGANWSQGDFNFDGDVDVWQFDGKGDAQQLSSNLGANLDIALEEAIVEEADAAEPLAAAVDWQSEYESTQSKAAKRKAVEATVDLLLATEWRS